jgi:hypothetical protein
METSIKKATRLASSVCLLALCFLTETACSGGGGAAPVTTASDANSGSPGNTSSGSSDSSSSSSSSSGNSSSGTSSGSSGSSGSTSPSGASGNTSSGSTSSGNISSGSSGSTSSGSSGSTPPSSLSLTSPPPSCSANVCITAPGTPTFGSATPVTENGATPNFAASLPPVGTTFSLMTTGRQISLHTVTDANVSGGTLTFRGVSSGNPIVDLSIPGVGLNASNLVMNGSIRQSDDSRLNFTVAPSGALSYAMMGTWSYFASTGVSGFDGAALTGYQTQAGHVPTSGAATFIGLRGSAQGDAKAGGVTGQIWGPSDSGNPITGGGLSGNAQLSINFATGSVAGQLTNMTVGIGGGSAWNDVNLSGSLSGASVSGTTSTPGQCSRLLPPGHEQCRDRHIQGRAVWAERH